MAEQYTVPEGAGRLDAWLAEVSGRSRAEIARLIEAGLVLVDGRPGTRSQRPMPGQIVKLEEPPQQGSDHQMPTFDVRYEDACLAVISKGPGTVVHPGAGTRGPTLVEAVGKSIPLAQTEDPHRPGVVHRLDRDTSGLLLFAKTSECHAALTSAIKQRKISRSYTALVAGRFDAATGRIEAPISRSPRSRQRMTVMAGGRPAVTEFRVLETIGPLSLLEVSLVTGRTHQIRVHFAHIGRPVVGDPSYGRSTLPTARRIGLGRQFLHAHRLAFLHPQSGEAMQIEDELAHDLAASLAAAREQLA